MSARSKICFTWRCDAPGTALAATGQRVLIFDTDPQGNASTGVDIHPDDRQVTAYEVLVGAEPFLQMLHRQKSPSEALVGLQLSALLGGELNSVPLDDLEKALEPKGD